MATAAAMVTAIETAIATLVAGAAEVEVDTGSGKRRYRNHDLKTLHESLEFWEKRAARQSAGSAGIARIQGGMP